jgi:hypothetical protein
MCIARFTAARHGRSPYHHRPAHPIHRPGCRRYNDGLWYSLTAFGAGAVVGGAATQPAYASSHIQWWANRYRTYRASDNTYQPNSGPRAQCVCPEPGAFRLQGLLKSKKAALSSCLFHDWPVTS